MNKCLYCGKDVKNKYCNVTCQNKHQGKKRVEKIHGKYKFFDVICDICGNQFSVEERDKKFPTKEYYYCSVSCSNTRKHSEETKKKIAETLKNKPKKGKIISYCKECGKKMEDYPSQKRECCSKSCKMTLQNKLYNTCSKGGKKAATIEVRRSKNEIYFAELCEKHFMKVLTNKNIFNGWDADVIIEDLKIAVLWNGKWHYEKITKKHSLKQVQNRDKIKNKEIIKCGYKPYIIKDMGKHNKEFVKEKFDLFLEEIYNGILG